MALFGSKKKKVQKGEAPASKQSVVSAAGHSFDLSTIIRGPRVTEKATSAVEKGVYVFNVASDATKKSIAFAIQARYNVKPLKVRTSSIKRKQVISRGKKGMVGGGKKAYVYLKAGQTIQLV